AWDVYRPSASRDEIGVGVRECRCVVCGAVTNGSVVNHHINVERMPLLYGHIDSKRDCVREGPPAWTNGGYVRNRSRRAWWSRWTRCSATTAPTYRLNLIHRCWSGLECTRQDCRTQISRRK